MSPPTTLPTPPLPGIDTNIMLLSLILSNQSMASKYTFVILLYKSSSRLAWRDSSDWPGLEPITEQEAEDCKQMMKSATVIYRTLIPCVFKQHTS